MPTLIDQTDLEDYVADPDVFLRLFDRDNDGTADPAVISRCIRTADSKLRMRVGAAFKTELDDPAGTVDEAIKGACVAYALLEAVQYNPSFEGEARNPYFAGAKIADDFLDRLAKDDRNRAKTSAVGRAFPRARVGLTQTPRGTATNPFGRQRDGRDRTGY